MGLTYPPVRLVHQITGQISGASDCGPATAAMTVDFATGGRIRPSLLEIRRRMGVPHGPTTVHDQEQAVESYDREAVHVGLRPVHLAPHLRGDWHDCHAVMVAQTRWLGLVLDYETINDDPVGRRLSGDKNFMGLHFLGAFGHRVDGRGIQRVRIYDPLADGRRPGIPEGVRWWPVELVRRAMADAAGPGRATWTQTARCERLPRHSSYDAGEGFAEDAA